MKEKIDISGLSNKQKATVALLPIILVACQQIETQPFTINGKGDQGDKDSEIPTEIADPEEEQMGTQLDGQEDGPPVAITATEIPVPTPTVSDQLQSISYLTAQFSEGGESGIDFNVMTNAQGTLKQLMEAEGYGDDNLFIGFFTGKDSNNAFRWDIAAKGDEGIWSIGVVENNTVVDFKMFDESIVVGDNDNLRVWWDVTYNPTGEEGQERPRVVFQRWHNGKWESIGALTPFEQVQGDLFVLAETIVVDGQQVDVFELLDIDPLPQKEDLVLVPAIQALTGELVAYPQAAGNPGIPDDSNNYTHRFVDGEWLELVTSNGEQISEEPADEEEITEVIPPLEEVVGATPTPREEGIEPTREILEDSTPLPEKVMLSFEEAQERYESGHKLFYAVRYENDDFPNGEMLTEIYRVEGSMVISHLLNPDNISFVEVGNELHIQDSNGKIVAVWTETHGWGIPQFEGDGFRVLLDTSYWEFDEGYSAMDQDYVYEIQPSNKNLHGNLSGTHLQARGDATDEKFIKYRGDMEPSVLCEDPFNGSDNITNVLVAAFAILSQNTRNPTDEHLLNIKQILTTSDSELIASTPFGNWDLRRTTIIFSRTPEKSGWYNNSIGVLPENPFILNPDGSATINVTVLDANSWVFGSGLAKAFRVFLGGVGIEPDNTSRGINIYYKLGRAAIPVNDEFLLPLLIIATRNNKSQGQVDRSLFDL